MKADKTKRVEIRKLLLGGMFTVSLVMIMISVSFSWFTSNSTAKVTGIQMQVSEGERIKIQIGNNMDTTMKFDFDAKYPLQARSGNGMYFYDAVLGYPSDLPEGSTVLDKVPIGYTFVVGPSEPSVEEFETETSSENGAEDTPIQDQTSEEVQNYIKNGICAVDFKITLDKEADAFLYLKKNDGTVLSVATPASASAYPNGNKSPYGSFDVGNICGALRVAILQKDGEGNFKPTLIWIPNTSIELYIDEKTKEMKLNDQSTNYETRYIFVEQDENGDAKEIIIDVQNDMDITGDASAGYVTRGNVMYAWGSNAEKLPIGRLSNGATDFRLMVWVDGNDRECHNALLSGLVFLKLHFGL